MKTLLISILLLTVSRAFPAEVAFGKAAQLTPEFKTKVIAISADLGIEPDHLMTVFAIETSRVLPDGGVEETFDPHIKTPAGNAVGLIQFLPSTATSLGTSTADLLKMSAVEQLDYVKKYLATYKGKMTTVEDTYLAVFYPAMIGQPDTAVLPLKYYQPNHGLDKDHDGKITRGEIAAFVHRKLEKGLKLKG